MAAANQAFPGILSTPEYAGNVYDIQTKQALAQALLQKGLQGNLAAYQPAGGGFGYVPRMGIGGALAGSVLPSVLGAALQRQANQELTSLGQQQQAALVQMLSPQTTTQSAASGAIGGGGAAGASPSPQALASGLSDQPQTVTTASPFNPSGLDPRVAARIYSQNPDKWIENVLSYNKPAEIVAELRAAGIDPNSMIGQQLAQARIAQKNYIAPLAGGAGQVYRDPITKQVVAQNPNIGEGMQAAYDAQGNFIGTIPIPGYTGAVQGIEGARAMGRAAGETQQVFNPATQQMEIVPRSQVLGGGGMPAAGGGLGTGRFSGAPAGGGIAAAPALGAQEAAAVEGKGQAEAGLRLQGEAEAAPQQRLFIRELRQTMSGFDPGNPKADWALTMKKMVNTVNPFGNTFDPNKIASQEQFNKAANQLAMAQFKDLSSGGAQSTLETAMRANPNATISRLGNKGIIDLLQGNVDAKERMGAEWQRWKESNGPGSYGKFQTEWRKSYDPQVFMVPYQSKEEAAAMVNAMTPNERKVFQQKFNFAVQNGWIQLPE